MNPTQIQFETNFGRKSYGNFMDFFGDFSMSMVVGIQGKISPWIAWYPYDATETGVKPIRFCSGDIVLRCTHTLAQNMGTPDR